MSNLEILGGLVTALYFIFIFAFQWVTDWFFNVEESPTITYLYSCWLYVTTKGT